MKSDTFTHLDLTVEDGVATVLLDQQGEAINTLGPHLFDDLESLMDRLEEDPTITSVVLGSAKKDFVVGADLKWFARLETVDEAEAAIRAGHRMMDRLEAIHTRYGKPVVAAIHGAALGGGCELALACSMRIAADTPKTVLGQPEVKVGILPAGGGTVRLPQLIGLADALDLILTGRSVRPGKARKLGLVDEVVPPELLIDVARRRAREASVAGADTAGAGGSVIERVTKLALESNPVGRKIVFSKARESLLEETKGNYPGPERALEAVRIGVEQGRSAGLDAESRFFGELVVSPQSKALRSIFFATRSLDRERWVDADPRRVDAIAVLGGGLMGGGIASVSALKAGASVRIKEVDPDAVARGLAHVASSVDQQVKRRRLRPFEGEQARLRVTGSDRWLGFEDVDLVIEAVFEDLELKRSIMGEMGGLVGSEVVLATNTSSIPIAEIAAGSAHADRILGMHYFSPVEKMPLLEIVVTSETSDQAIATAVEFGKRQGKTVIVVNDGTGFYTTRVLGPYTNEAMFLLEEGASVEDIDGAMESWGFPVGPIRLADEVGLDVGAKIAKIMVGAFGDRMRGPEVMSELVADDRKGRKNGRGFYAYDDSGKRIGVDESVYDVMGLGPRIEVGRLEIQRRISLAFINEAARCLEEDVLRSARDGDIGAVMGLGFPPFRGGPFWYVDEVGADVVVGWLEELSERHGERFRPAGILERFAEEGHTFRR